MDKKTLDTGSLAASWDLALRDFADAGFNLIATIDPRSLPPALATQLGPDQQSSGLLFAAGAKELYSAMQAAGAQTHDDPFDTYSVQTVSRVLSEHLPTATFEIAYPGSGPAPLIGLGEYLGWSHPSPLGLGINPKFGLWFAYRAFVRIDTQLPATTPVATASPCDSCVSRDCIAACPSGAVVEPGKFAIDKCADFRLQPSSSCEDTCLARLACPVAIEHQYSREQFAYHQRRALAGLKRWQGNKSNPEETR